MAWLGPAHSTDAPFSPEIRHWKSGKLLETVPLQGMHFFDAWRIRSSPRLESLLGGKLTALGSEELIPYEAPHTEYGQAERADIQHRREQEREARVHAKTTAQKALELAHVHRLAVLVSDHSDMLRAMAIQRQSYQEQLKETSDVKNEGERATTPKKQQMAAGHSPVTTPRTVQAPTAHGGQALPADAHAVQRQRSDTPYPYPFTSMPQIGGATSSTALPVPPAPREPVAEPMAPGTERTESGLSRNSAYLL